MQQPVFTYHPGHLPLFITVPHAGTALPEDLGSRLSADSHHLPDTDWHIPQLYAFVKEIGAHLLVAHYSRYVIDLNRPEDDTSLYPGRFTTGLVPLHRFDKRPLYRAGQEPDAAEVQQRIDLYWRPYHQKIADVLRELRHQHDRVVLWDAHSITSHVPAFFEGELPTVNLGTVDGQSCDHSLQQRLEAVAQASGYTWVMNGRFKGGYTTRHYGQPSQGLHAVQLELAQSSYMEETYPFTYVPDKAKRLQEQVLQPLLRTVAGFLGAA